MIPAGEVAFRAEIESDLSLLDRPPEALAITDDLALDRLPVLVFDTETTGLDVTDDRIVSIGAVRLDGPRVYRGVSVDQLVNPGRGIPARSTAIHGITDAMVRDAEPFPEVFAQFRPHLEGVVAVGHQVAFDLAMLRRECALAGLDWSAPESLDTCQLASQLEPGLPGLGLEHVADWLGGQRSRPAYRAGRQPGDGGRLCAHAAALGRSGHHDLRPSQDLCRRRDGTVARAGQSRLVSPFLVG